VLGAGSDRRRIRKRCMVGIRNKDFSQIVSGITEERGDHTGGYAVSDGTKIKIESPEKKKRRRRKQRMIRIRRTLPMIRRKVAIRMQNRWWCYKSAGKGRIAAMDFQASLQGLTPVPFTPANALFRKLSSPPLFLIVSLNLGGGYFAFTIPVIGFVRNTDFPRIVLPVDNGVNAH